MYEFENVMAKILIKYTIWKGAFAILCTMDISILILISWQQYKEKVTSDSFMVYIYIKS